ncbi:MAG: PepSY domain-containing protein [Flavobacterium sp.]|nr:PepSY domain-containing protein [Candidatus Neoflavobacterium equi]
MKDKNKKSKSSFKKVISKLHLWLGLSVGFIVFFISITRVLYVFREEIKQMQRREIIYHHEPNFEVKELLPIRELEQRINQQVPQEYPIHWVTIPNDKSIPYRFYWYEHQEEAWHYFEEFPLS